MKLSFKRGKGDKIHILSDGEYILTVDESFFYSLGLKDGMELSAGELNEIAEKINCRRAYNQLISYLSRRDHSERELFQKLKQKGYEHYAECALQKAKDEGYVSDERFAESFASELKKLKGYGKRRIESELYKKGIDRETISVVMTDFENDTEKLNGLIKRKYYRYLSDEKGRAKVFNSLLRLGYSYSEIKDALRNFEEVDEENFYEV